MRRFVILFGFFSLLILASVQVAARYPLSGEHKYISGKEVDCARCHPRQESALNQSAYHQSLNCSGCHATGNPYQEGKTARNHSATLVPCTATGCHEDVLDTTSINGSINSTYESHRGLFREAGGHLSTFGTYKENEACLACHASFTSDITFIYPEYINFTLRINWSDTTAPTCDTSNSREYNINSLVKGPSRSERISLPANNPHNLVNTSAVDCSSDCHKYIADSADESLRLYPNHASDAINNSNDPYHNTTDPDYAYCQSCHRNLTYASYSSVHSNETHASESIDCTDCHRSGGPMDITQQEPFGGGEHACLLYDNITSYPQKFHGDICLSCHFANSHNGFSTEGCLCHSPASEGKNISGYINFTIYAEPSGSRDRSITITD